jgi:hypothetical protein
MGTTLREWARGEGRDPATWVAKVTFVVMCGGGVAWLLVPAVLASSGEIDLPWTSVFFYFSVFASPPILYAALIHRKGFVIVIGAALAALELWSVWSALTGESSTSGLAVLSIPFFGIPLVLVGRLLQTWTRPGP